MRITSGLGHAQAQLFILQVHTFFLCCVCVHVFLEDNVAALTSLGSVLQQYSSVFAQLARPANATASPAAATGPAPTDGQGDATTESLDTYAPFFACVTAFVFRCLHVCHSKWSLVLSLKMQFFCLIHLEIPP